MTNHIISNCIGCFIIDNNLNIIDQKIYSEKDLKEIYSKDKNELPDEEKKLMSKHQAKEPTPALEKNILAKFKDKEYFKSFHNNNLIICKQKMRKAFTYNPVSYTHLTLPTN